MNDREKHDVNRKAWNQGAGSYLTAQKGCTFHVFDIHPALAFVDIDAVDFRCSGLSYFNYELEAKDCGENYIGDLRLDESRKESRFERAWTLSDVFTSLTDAGLIVTKLGEQREEFWDCMPKMKREAKGLLPMTFSMMAVKP